MLLLIHISLLLIFTDFYLSISNNFDGHRFHVLHMYDLFHLFPRYMLYARSLRFWLHLTGRCGSLLVAPISPLVREFIVSDPYLLVGVCRFGALIRSIRSFDPSTVYLRLFFIPLLLPDRALHFSFFPALIFLMMDNTFP